MKKLIMIMAVLSGICYGQRAGITISDFGGKVTTITPDKIADRNSPILLNGYTDDGGMFTKRRGTIKANSTTCEGLKPIRRIGIYPLNSITSYLTYLSSNSWGYLLNGVPTTICNGLTISAIDDYTVANGFMYRDNGEDGFGGKWNGTTYYPFEVPVLSSCNVISVVISSMSLVTGLSSTTANFTAWNTPTQLRVSLDCKNTNYAYLNTTITGYSEHGTLLTEVVVSTIGKENYTSHLFYQVSTITWSGLVAHGDFGINTSSPIRVNVGKLTYSMMGGKYIRFWNNRMWKAGKNSSIVYYSAVGATAPEPENFNQTYRNININVNDGDIITGLTIWNDRLIVTKKYSVYEIYEAAAGDFRLRRLYEGIGCLYNQTIDVLPTGNMVWMSHRGVEEFNGNSFNLISDSNDEFFKSLPQMGDATLTYSDTTKADWDKGTSVEMSSTNPTDSLTVVTSTEINQQSSGGIGYTPGATMWQEFKSSYTAKLESIWIQNNNNAGVTTMVLSSGNLTTTYTIVVTESLGWNKYNFSGYDITLSSGVSYRFTISESIPGSTLRGYMPNYSRGESSIGVGPIAFRLVMVKPVTASYTSGIININALGLNTWTSWNSFNATSNIESGASYFIKVATATEVVAAAPFVSVSKSSLINLTTGAFIQYKITTTSASFQLDDVTITANGETASPIGKVYDRRYWLAITTNTTLSANTVVAVYQKNKEWTLFNNMNIASMGILKGELYYGESTATGQIYKTDVNSIWQDNGANYNSFWRSKLFDFNAPMSNKVYETMWASAESSIGNSTNIRYALNGSDIWHTKLFPLTSANETVTEKIQFDAWTKGKQIQFEIGDNDSHDFKFKRLDLLYSAEQPE